MIEMDSILEVIIILDHQSVSSADDADPEDAFYTLGGVIYV